MFTSERFRFIYVCAGLDRSIAVRVHKAAAIGQFAIRMMIVGRCEGGGEGEERCSSHCITRFSSLLRIVIKELGKKRNVLAVCLGHVTHPARKQLAGIFATSHVLS